VDPGSGYSAGGPVPSVKRTDILLVLKVLHAEGKWLQRFDKRPLEDLDMDWILKWMLKNRT
jgi:hypothetical protein